MRPRSVAVVGGGITGLTAAWSVLRAAPDTEVVLYEAAAELGGKIKTVGFAGGRIEAGPDSFLARDPDVVALLDQVGLGDALIEPAVFGAALWVGGRLRRLPEGSFWGLPVGASVALRAEALSGRGRIRALADLVSPRRLRGADVSVAHFIGRRFGEEVLTRLVDPLLAGTRSGAVETMSLAAGLPQVDSIARRHRSVMRGIAWERRGGVAASGPPPFKAVAGGMSSIVSAIAHALDSAEIVTGSAVATVGRRAEQFEVTTAAGETRRVDGVVLCVPARAAAELVRPFSNSAAAALATIQHAPACSVALGYRQGALSVPRGTSGILLPRSAKTTISACTWWTTKWPGSVPEHQVVRCFVGRASADPVPEEDGALVEACARDLRNIAGRTEDPIESHVTRWEEGLPQYRVGHLEKVAAIERALDHVPGLALAGASYRGSGLPDCIAQGRRAADRVVSAPIR